MAFHAKSFVYDSIDSDTYGLQIASIEVGGMSSNKASGNTEILETFIYKKPKPYFYGIQYTSRLEFPVAFFSENEITASMLSFILNWLFNKSSYRNFAIMQDDMDEYYMQCIFTDPVVRRIGNVVYGVSGTCKLDSQFAYTRSKTITYTNPLPTSITFQNNSHCDNGYLYPTLNFTMGTSGGNLSMTNANDDDRIFSFTGLLGSEIVNVNNDLGIITSSTGSPILSKFNKNFLRFVPGVNVLAVSGSSVSTLSLTYQFLRQIGA